MQSPPTEFQVLSARVIIVREHPKCSIFYRLWQAEITH